MTESHGLDADAGLERIRRLEERLALEPGDSTAGTPSRWSARDSSAAVRTYAAAGLAAQPDGPSRVTSESATAFGCGEPARNTSKDSTFA